MENIDPLEIAKADFNFGSIGLIIKNSKNPDGLNNVDDIQGYVNLVLSETSFVKGVWVKFSAKCSTPTKDGSLDLLRNEEDYYKGGVSEVFVGFGEYDSDSGQLLEMAAGSYSWPFHFKMPKHNFCQDESESIGAPLSYCDKNAEVIYSIKATFDTPALPRALTQVVHTLFIGKVSESVASKIEIPTNILGQLEVPVVKQQQKMWQALMERLNPPVMLHISADRPAIFPFEVTDTTIKVKCTLEHLYSTKSISVKAKLYVQILTRQTIDTPYTRKIPATTNMQDGCFVHKLWVSSKTNLEKDKSVTFDVPIVIDPLPRQQGLTAWPQPTKLQHSDNKILYCTSSGPLHQYGVFIEISVVSGMNKNKKLVCGPCVKQIFVRAPIEVRSRAGLMRTDANTGVIRPPLHNLPLRSVVGTTSTFIHSSESATNSISNSISTSSTNGNSNVSKTPHAKIALPKVKAELLSRGPAAALIDSRARNQQQPRHPEGTHFAELHRVTTIEASMVLVGESANAVAMTPRRANQQHQLHPFYSPSGTPYTPAVVQGMGVIPFNTGNTYSMMNGTYRGSLTETPFIECIPFQFMSSHPDDDDDVRRLCAAESSAPSPSPSPLSTTRISHLHNNQILSNTIQRNQNIENENIENQILNGETNIFVSAVEESIHGPILEGEIIGVVSRGSRNFSTFSSGEQREINDPVRSIFQQDLFSSNSQENFQVLNEISDYQEIDTLNVSLPELPGVQSPIANIAPIPMISSNSQVLTFDLSGDVSRRVNSANIIHSTSSSASLSLSRSSSRIVLNNNTGDLVSNDYNEMPINITGTTSLESSASNIWQEDCAVQRLMSRSRSGSRLLSLSNYEDLCKYLNRPVSVSTNRVTSSSSLLSSSPRTNLPTSRPSSNSNNAYMRTLSRSGMLSLDAETPTTLAARGSSTNLSYISASSISSSPPSLNHVENGSDRCSLILSRLNYLSDKRLLPSNLSIAEIDDLLRMIQMCLLHDRDVDTALSTNILKRKLMVLLALKRSLPLNIREELLSPGGLVELHFGNVSTFENESNHPGDHEGNISGGNISSTNINESTSRSSISHGSNERTIVNDSLIAQYSTDIIAPSDENDWIAEVTRVLLDYPAQNI